MSLYIFKDTMIPSILYEPKEGFNDGPLKHSLILEWMANEKQIQ